MLELGLLQWAMSRLVRNGFIPVMPPDIVRSSFSESCGFQPREDSLDSQVYKVRNGSIRLFEKKSQTERVR